MTTFAPLDGLRVLELSGAVGVAYCARVLADFGAEVVKAEPATGDPTRRLGPRDPTADSPVFIYANTGKHGVLADPADPADQTLNRLLDSADVAVGGLEHRLLARSGIESRVRDGGLIYLSIRPYGLVGPDAERPGTELDVFHAGGEGSLLPGGLSYGMFPDRPPVKAGRHLIDYDAGNVGALLVLALVRQRLSTGVGALVDVSEQDVAISLGRVTIDRQLNQGIRVNRADRGYDYGGIFPCREGYITVRPTQDRFWAALATGIGRPDLVDDPRFATRFARESHPAELDDLIRTWCSTRTAEEVHELLAPLGTPVGYYADARSLLESTHAWTRGDLARIAGLDEGLVVPRPGYTFGGRPLPAPTQWPATPGRGDTTFVGSGLGRPVPAAAGARRASAEKPLAGVRVLDLTWVAAGPYTTELLSMLGAEIVKVESTNHPDLFRQLADTDVVGLNRSNRFNAVNLSKQSIGLNFKHPEGRTLLRRLALEADLIVSNYRPGALERLGLTYDELAAEKPGIVVVCISSAGRGGTDPGYAGYASIFNSIGGLGHLTGYPDGPPVEVRDSVDLRVGTVAAVGATAALLARARGGSGCAVDVSAQQAITGLVGDSVVEAQLFATPMRAGNGLYDLWPYGVYPCAGDDEWVAIATTDAEQRSALGSIVGCRCDGRPPEERPEVDRAIASWTSTRGAQDVARALLDVGVPASKVLGGDDILVDKHLRARGLLADVDHPTLGSQVVIGHPWRIDDEIVPVHAAPSLGADSADVLGRWLGLDPAEIDRLVEQGAVELVEDDA